MLSSASLRCESHQRIVRVGTHVAQVGLPHSHLGRAQTVDRQLYRPATSPPQLVFCWAHVTVRPVELGAPSGNRSAVFSLSKSKTWRERNPRSLKASSWSVS